MKNKWLVPAVLFLGIFFIGTGAFWAQGKEDYTFPILMYHDITTDPACVNSMTVTQARFLEDMQYLADEGYTPLLPAELVSLAASPHHMPKKPVMITFDDGYVSNYLYAYPILRQTGMKAVISLITANMRVHEDDSYQIMMTWAQAAELAQSGIIELGSHTHNLHNPDSAGCWIDGGPNGIGRAPGESEPEYTARVGGDLKTSLDLIRQHTGREVIYFSYPLGQTDAWFTPLLQQNGIKVTVTTTPGRAEYSQALYDLPRCRVTMDVPLSALLTSPPAAKSS